MIYIHKELRFYEVTGLLSDNFETGAILDDYRSGKFVLLNNQQVKFMEDNPGAVPEEVFNLQISPKPQMTLEETKSRRIAEITSYDLSENVNCFFINNTSMWLDRNTRASLYTTVAAYKASGIEEITLWTTNSNPFPVTLPVIELEGLLTRLELYAKKCYDVTAQHKAVIGEMIYVADVSIYDIKTGYPGKLSLQV